MDEKEFWFERANRAFIRCEDAIERGDSKAAAIARKQHSLYRRRYDAVPMPKAVRESLAQITTELAQIEAEERRAALDEV